ncbi:MAG: hypothetical protein HDT11_01185 [Helicobacter sp.]|nr:hypothetical protein [Helicobacter sp.]
MSALLVILVWAALTENQDLLFLSLSFLFSEQIRAIARMLLKVLLLTVALLWIVTVLPKEVTETKPRVFLATQTHHERCESSCTLAQKF